MDGEMINANLALLLATFRFTVSERLYVQAGWHERKMLYFETINLIEITNKMRPCSGIYY